MSTNGYSYRTSVKSSLSDELVNTWLLRPMAGLLVRVLYSTPVTPNHLTLASIVAGFVAAGLYLGGVPQLTAAAGLMITAKDVLDSADGQLARAKQMYSRTGRFLDSIGDFVVNLAVFAALGAVLFTQSGDPWMCLLALLGFAGISLRVSYHVFYQTSYLHLGEAYAINRTTEEVREEDLRGEPLALTLQRLFQVLYGWQDRLMVRIDCWCRRDRQLDENERNRWYSDPAALRLSGLIGIGTELFALMLFSLANSMAGYLWWNIVVMNAVWATAILYRRLWLRQVMDRSQAPR